MYRFCGNKFPHKGEHKKNILKIKNELGIFNTLYSSYLLGSAVLSFTLSMSWEVLYYPFYEVSSDE